MRVLFVHLSLDVNFYKYKTKVVPEVMQACKAREGRRRGGLARLSGALAASFRTNIEK